MTTDFVSVDTLFQDATRLFRKLPLFSPARPEDSLTVDVPQMSLRRLVPTRPPATRDWFLKRLLAFTTAEPGSSRTSSIETTALKAGLLLWHDYLDESHELAQSIEGQGAHRPGDYWHAILHRREPDYANAKYWFRHVGRQPIFGELRQKAADLLADCSSPEAARWRARLQKKTEWDPFAFVDLCEVCANDENSELALVARKVQLAEMALLLEFTRAQL